MVDMEEVAKAGWRCCQDHLLKPEHPCPICRIEVLQKDIKGCIKMIATQETTINQLTAKNKQLMSDLAWVNRRLKNDKPEAD